jgi:uncharacterized protein YjbI with pentapeptide repeats
MADKEQLEILKQGVVAWNTWREEHSEIKPDFGKANLSTIKLRRANLNWVEKSNADLSNANLSGADLSGANLSSTRLINTYLSGADLKRAKLMWTDLSFANLSDANLSDADLSGAIIFKANLSGADLSGAKLNGVDLSGTNLSSAHLSGANLKEANLNSANLSVANLNKADLTRATLVGTNLEKAILTDCRIYGISAWDVQLDGAEQLNLTITPNYQPTITIDNLKVAQFIYLLLNNAEIREVIDTITSKVVLILGRFTTERKAVLDALRDELRKWNYSPILFDFDEPASRDITETVSILAHMARFIIADLTEPSSIPKELEAIVPTLAVPVQPLLEGSTRSYAMFKDYWKYQWVLKVYRYNGLEELLVSLKEHVIEPAEQKLMELAKQKAEE